MLCSLWPTQHTPVYWKQRWLVPLPKTDELTSIEDLEIFRKLRTSILTHRIQNAWDTHNLLLIDALKQASSPPETYATHLVA